MRLRRTLAFVLISYLLCACRGSHGNYSFICNQKRYELVKERLSYSNAVAYAQDHGARLAEITTEAEQTCIFNAITHDGGLNTTYVKCDDGGGISYVWTGIDTIKKKVLFDSLKNVPTGKNWVCERASLGYSYSNWASEQQKIEHEEGKFKVGIKATAIALSDWTGEKDQLGNEIKGKAGQWNDINANYRLYFVIVYGNK